MEEYPPATKENDFILDDYEVNYDEEYNDLKKYTEKENSLKATEFYRNDKFVYKITRIGNLFRTNITAGIKKNRTTRLKGTRNDNGLLYVVIDKKKYLLAKLVYKYFGDREKIIAVGDDGFEIFKSDLCQSIKKMNSIEVINQIKESGCIELLLNRNEDVKLFILLQ